MKKLLALFTAVLIVTFFGFITNETLAHDYEQGECQTIDSSNTHYSICDFKTETNDDDEWRIEFELTNEKDTETYFYFELYNVDTDKNIYEPEMHVEELEADETTTVQSRWFSSENPLNQDYRLFHEEDVNDDTSDYYEFSPQTVLDNTHTVEFVDYDGTELKTEKIEEGEDATPPDNEIVSEFNGHENYIYALAVDSSDNVYSGSVDDTLKKTSSDGEPMWSYDDVESNINGVDVGPNDNVYAGFANGEVRKLDSDGGHEWTYSKHDDVIQDVAVDSDGNVYSAGDGNTVHKIDPDGNKVLEYTEHDERINDLYVDSSDNVYTASDDNETHKIDSDGNQKWVYEASRNIESVVVNADDEVYSAVDDELHKLDSSGSNVWTEEFSTNIYDIGVDDSYIYTVHHNGFLRKLDFSGNLEWETTDELDDRIHAMSVASTGDIYTGSYKNLIKFDSNGEFEWVFNELSAYDNTTDDSGNHYTAGSEGITKLSPDFAQIWRYSEHTDRIKSVKTDSDGNVYSGSDDNTVHKIDSDGNRVWEYGEHTDDIEDVSIDSDGNVYSVSSDDEVHKIDSDGDKVWAYTEHSDRVNGVSVDADGDVYTVSDDNEIHKIDSDGNQVWTYTEHTDDVKDIEIDSDGYAYTASWGGDVHKIDSDGSNDWKFTTSYSNVGSIALDGNFIYAGYPEGAITKIDKEGSQLATFEFSFLDEFGYIQDLYVDSGYVYTDSYDSDFVTLLIGEPYRDGYVFDGWDGNYTDVQEDETVTATYNELHTVTFEDHDGSLLEEQEVEEGADAQDPKDNLFNEWIYEGHDENVTSVEVDGDDNVYSASGSSGQIHKTDSEGNHEWTYDGHSDSVWNIAVDSDGYLYTSSNDGENHKVDPDGELVWTYSEHSGDAGPIEIGPDGSIYTVDDGNREIHKIDPDGSQIWTHESDHSSRIYDLHVDVDGNIYTTSGDDTVRKLDSSRNLEWEYTEHSATVDAVTSDSDGNVYTASYDDTVHKIDSEGVQQWSYEGHDNNVFDVQVDDGIVYTSSADDTVHKIDSSGNFIGNYEGHSQHIESIVIGFEGNYLYSASSDDTVHKLRNGLYRDGHDFSGWDGDYTDVQQDETVTATYDASTYDFRFEDWDETLLKRETVEHGSDVTPPSEGVSKLWDYEEHPSTVYNVSVDDEGNVYSSDDDGEVHKTDSDGNTVWTFTKHTDSIEDITVDSDGNIYTASADNTVRKIDPDGNEIWSYEGHTGHVNGVVLGNNEKHVYTGSGDDSAHKITASDAELVWEYTKHNTWVEDVAVDSEGYLYTVSQGEEVHKVDSDGERVWRFTGYSTPIYEIIIDSNDDIYTKGSDTLRKIDSDGNQIWSRSEIVHDLTLDNADNLYYVSEDELNKFSPSGELVWTDDTYVYDDIFAQDNDGMFYISDSDFQYKKVEIGPMRDFHDFDTWEGSYTDIKQDGTATANYDPYSFTVTFEDHDGDVLKEEEVDYSEDVTPPADPERQDYIFSGWDGNYTDIEQDETVVATYEEKDYDLNVESPYFHYARPDSDMPSDPDTHGIWDLEFDITPNFDDTAEIEIYELDHDNKQVGRLYDEEIDLTTDNAEDFTYEFKSDDSFPYEIVINDNSYYKGYVRPWSDDIDDFQGNALDIFAGEFGTEKKHSNYAFDEFTPLHFTSTEGEDGSIRIESGNEGSDYTDIPLDDLQNDNSFLILPTENEIPPFIDGDLRSLYEDKILDDFEFKENIYLLKHVESSTENYLQPRPLILDNHDYVYEIDLDKDEAYKEGWAVTSNYYIPNKEVRSYYSVSIESSSPDFDPPISDLNEEGVLQYKFTAPSEGSYTITLIMGGKDAQTYELAEDFDTKEPTPVPQAFNDWLEEMDINTGFIKILIGFSFLGIVTLILAFKHAGIPAMFVTNIVIVLTLILWGFIPSWFIVVLGLAILAFIFISAFHYGGFNR